MKLQFVAKMLFAVCTALLVSGSSFGQNQMAKRAEPEGKFGVGASIGQKSGLSLFYGISESDFVQSTVSFDNDGDSGVFVDYALAFPERMKGYFTPYVGLGALVHDSDYDTQFENDEEYEGQTFVAARLPIGVRYDGFPIQLALEAAPALTLIPVRFGYVQAAFTARVLM
ncbi:MAG: hypothetical protein AB7T49_15535 [Oligoflexales bacterium]